MFESVNALSRRLPHPVITGDPRRDGLARAQIMMNARRLQSEAFSCVGRAFLASLRQGWNRLARPVGAPASHQT